MDDRIEYLKRELEKAQALSVAEARREQMREAARELREYLDAMAEQGISEDRAWKMILTVLKN